MRGIVALIGMCFFFCRAGLAEEPVPPRTRIPAEVRASLDAHENLEYARYGDRVLRLDLYRPKNADKPLPGVVCIHGGGWERGSRSTHANLAMAIAARGYVAVTITYRLSGEARFPAQIHDCKAAVRWMRANAAKYGVDPDQIGATGLSAGGHLAGLLATSEGVRELEGAGGGANFSSRIQAAVPMGAQSDLLSERVGLVSAMKERGSVWRRFLGGSQAEATARYRLASPLQHLDEHDPPIYFISGANDHPVTRATTFRLRAEELMIPTGITLIPGAPHAFLVRSDWFGVAVEDAVEFFDEHLK